MKVSKTGYKRNSKDKNEPALKIPSNNITMKGVDFPVIGISDTGHMQMMYPGMDYLFPGNYVYEIPMAQRGGDPSIPDLSNRGWLSKYQKGGFHQRIYTDPEEFRVANQNYNDSLDVYNLSQKVQQNRFNLPEIDKNTYNALSEKNKNLDTKRWAFDEVQYKEDKKKNKVGDFKEYMYEYPNYIEGVDSYEDYQKKVREISPKFAKNYPIEDDTPSKVVKLKNGVERHYQTHKGEIIDKGWYTDVYPNGTSRSYSDYKLFDIYTDNIKPVSYKYYGEDKPRESSRYDLSSSSTGWYTEGEKPKFKNTSNESYVDYYIPTDINEIYKKPEEQPIYKEPTEEPVYQPEIKPIASRSITLPTASNKELMPSKKLQMQEGIVPVREVYYAHFNPSHPDAGRVINYYDPVKKQYVRQPEYELRKDGDWLSKYQPGGVVIDPIYGELSREQADSLILYKAYQHALKNNIKGYNQWLNDMGSYYPGGPEELRKIREKNSGFKYGQKINNNKKSRYNDSSKDLQYDPAYSEDVKVINYYKSLVKNDPNFRIGEYSSPDLWHKNIMPMGMFYDGSETPIYKKPSFVKDDEIQSKPQESIVKPIKSRSGVLSITDDKGLMPSKKLQIKEGIVPTRETYYANFNPNHPDAGKITHYYDPVKKQIVKNPEYELRRDGGWLSKYQDAGQVPSKYDLMRVDRPTAVAESTNVVVPNIVNAPKQVAPVKQEAKRVAEKKKELKAKYPNQPVESGEDFYALEEFDKNIQENTPPANFSKRVSVPGVSGSLVTGYVDPNTGEQWTSPSTRAAQQASSEIASGNNIDPIGMGILTAAGAGPLVRTVGAALPYLDAPAVLPYLGEVPWLTANNVINAGFAANSLNQIVNPESELRTNPNAVNISETALGLLPFVGPATKLAGEATNAAGKYLTTQTPLREAWKYNPLAGTFAGESKLPNALQLNRLDDADAYWRLTKYPIGGLDEGAYFNKGVPLTQELAETFPKGSREWMHRYSGYSFNPKTGKLDVYTGPDYLFKVNDPSLMNTHFRFPESHLDFYRLNKNLSTHDDIATQYKKNWLFGWKKVNVPKTLPGSPNIDTGINLSLGKFNYEIKNPSYYQKLLDSYSTNQLSNSSKKYFQGIIKSIEKQNGMASKRQYDMLQRLKQGDFNYGPKGNFNLGLFNFIKNKPIVTEAESLSPLERQALTTQQDLNKANRDAIDFSQSAANRKKLQEFRPGKDFSVTNQQARFIDDPEAIKLYESYKLENDPSLSIEQYLGNARGQYGARHYGDLNDIVLVDKNQLYTSNIPSKSAYTDALHETTHSRSIRLGATDAEKQIAGEAWQPMINKNNFGMPEEEAFAVQNELRLDKLKDLKGERIYTEKDIPEIKKGLQEMIDENHEYLKGVNVNDFNMSALIKSLNKIGLGTVVPGAIATGAIAAGSQSTPEQKHGGWLSQYKEGGNANFDASYLNNNTNWLRAPEGNWMMGMQDGGIMKLQNAEKKRINTAAKGFNDYIINVTLSKSGGSTQGDWLNKYK